MANPIKVVVAKPDKGGGGKPGGSQYTNISTIGADQVHAIPGTSTVNYKGEGVTVALFDSGIEDHTDLCPRLASGGRGFHGRERNQA